MKLKDAEKYGVHRMVTIILQFAELLKLDFSERKKNNLSTPSTPQKTYLTDNQ